MNARERKRLGRRLAGLRDGAGMSRGELAVAIRSPSGPQQIGKWETGQNAPGARWLVALADLFETTTDYILGRTNEL